MIEHVYNYTFQGRTSDEIKRGTFDSLDKDIEYAPSLTDQTWNVSISSQVEDFVAAGKVIQALHHDEGVKEIPLENRLDSSLYGAELPEITQKIYQFDEKQKELEEKAKAEDEEIEHIKKQISKLKASEKSSETYED